MMINSIHYTAESACVNDIVPLTRRLPRPSNHPRITDEKTGGRLPEPPHGIGISVS